MTPVDSPGVLPEISPGRYPVAVHGETYLAKVLHGKFEGLNVTCRCLLTPRSKFCKELCRVVDRFDHYCMWIDNAVG